MSVLERAVVLPRHAFLVAWSMVDLPDPPPVIGTGRNLSADDADIRRLHDSTRELLVGKGLARGGRLNPVWVDTLRVIASPAREFYAFSHYRDDSHGAVLIAATDDRAVRVITDPDVVVVEPVSPEWPATKLLDSLPDVPAAPVRTIRITRAEWDNPDSHPADPLAEPADSRVRDEFTAVLAAPRDAAHQLYVARWDSDGHRRRSSPVTALDLRGRGRALTYATGDDCLVLVSGDTRETIKVLNDTAAGLV
ncbi:ESX secretion-associated protein EspG [Amycolatopsis sp. cmx-4-68]|uniref:ESX secretion-associated protein EspG n=1 Tax=Amycolatopsis sp. cmx-4-68 TaxID=2790938 RepID=UPI003978EC9C